MSLNISYASLLGVGDVMTDTISTNIMTATTTKTQYGYVDYIYANANSAITFENNIIPVNGTLSIGSATNYWNSLYITNLILSGLTANCPIFTNASKQLITQTMTNGQLIIGNTGNAPTIGSLSIGSTNLALTTGAGTLSLDMSMTPTITNLHCGSIYNNFYGSASGGNMSVINDVFPNTDITYSLGSNTYRYLNTYSNNLYASNSTLGSITCTSVTSSGSVISQNNLYVTGVTSSANRISIYNVDPNKGMHMFTNDQDGNTYASYQGGLCSWYGVGFKYIADNVCRHIFDVRSGNYSNTGTVTTAGIANSGNYSGTGSITCATVSCSSISSSGSITCGTISCSTISSSGSITCATISCSSISATGTFTCGTNSMTAGHIYSTAIDNTGNYSGTGSITCASVSCSSISSTGTFTNGTNSVTCGSITTSGSYTGTAGAITCGTNSLTSGGIACTSLNTGSGNATVGGTLTISGAGLSSLGNVTVNNLTVTGSFSDTTSSLGVITCTSIVSSTFLNGVSASLSGTANITSTLTCGSNVNIGTASVSNIQLLVNGFTGSTSSAGSSILLNSDQAYIGVDDQPNPRLAMVKQYGSNPRFCIDNTASYHTWSKLNNTITSANLQAGTFTDLMTLSASGILNVSGGITSGTNSMTAGALSCTSLSNSGTTSLTGTLSCGVISSSNTFTNGTNGMTTGALSCSSISSSGSVTSSANYSTLYYFYPAGGTGTQHWAMYDWNDSLFFSTRLVDFTYYGSPMILTNGGNLSITGTYTNGTNAMTTGALSCSSISSTGTFTCGTNAMTSGALSCTSISSTGTFTCGTNAMTSGALSCSSISSTGTFTCGTNAMTSGALSCTSLSNSGTTSLTGTTTCSALYGSSIQSTYVKHWNTNESGNWYNASGIYKIAQIQYQGSSIISGGLTIDGSVQSQFTDQFKFTLSIKLSTEGVAPTVTGMITGINDISSTLISYFDFIYVKEPIASGHYYSTVYMNIAGATPYIAYDFTVTGSNYGSSNIVPIVLFDPFNTPLGTLAVGSSVLVSSLLSQINVKVLNNNFSTTGTVNGVTMSYLTTLSSNVQTQINSLSGGVSGCLPLTGGVVQNGTVGAPLALNRTGGASSGVALSHQISGTVFCNTYGGEIDASNGFFCIDIRIANAFIGSYTGAMFYVTPSTTVVNNNLSLAGNLAFTGTTPFINFGANGSAGPTFTSRSTGTKLVLWSSLGGLSVDYGFGVSASSLWASVENTSAYFLWYGGQTQMMSLSNNNLVVTGPISSGSCVFTNNYGSLYGPPTFTSRSAGTSIVLAPYLGGSTVDYAIGYDAGVMWFSLPQYNTGGSFKFYGATTVVASITNNGDINATSLTTTANINGVSPTKMGYLTTLTSDAQTQLNNRLLLSGGNLSGNLAFTGTTPFINFSATGYNPPTFTSRSTGTKLVLWDSVGVTNSDYALGIESNTLWFSVPNTSLQFKWYGGTTSVMTLAGNGTLTTAGNVNGATPTAMSYVDATSSIQTQLNNRLPLSGGSLTGNLYIASKLEAYYCDEDFSMYGSYYGDATTYPNSFATRITGLTAYQQSLGSQITFNGNTITINVSLGIPSYISMSVNARMTTLGLSSVYDTTGLAIYAGSTSTFASMTQVPASERYQAADGNGIRCVNTEALFYLDSAHKYISIGLQSYPAGNTLKDITISLRAVR